MIQQELKVELTGIKGEQKKLRQSLDTIQGDLMEYDKDHLVLTELVSKVAGLTDAVNDMSRRLDRFHKKTADAVEDAVEKGIQPATDAAEEIAQGLKEGVIPITAEAAKNIQTSNFVSKFIKKWNHLDILGRDKKGR